MTTLTPLTPAVRAVVRLCSTALLLDTVFFSVLSPLLAGYADSAHLSETAVGLLVAAYPLGMVLAAFPAGSLVSRYGPRTVLSGGLTLIAVTCVLFALAASGPQLIAFRFVQGVGAVLVWASAMSWVTNVAPPDRRGELAGRALGMAVLGAVVGPVVGALATIIGTLPVFTAVALTFLALVAVAVRLPAPVLTDSPGWRHAFGLLRDHRLRLGIWLLALGGVGAGVVNTLAPLTLADLGVTAVGTSVVFLAMAASAALSSPRVGRRADRHGRYVVAVVVLVVGALAMLAIGIVSRTGGPLVVLVVLLVLGFVLIEASYVPGSALIADGTADADGSRGEVLALANLAWAMAMTAASLLAGVLLTHFGPVAAYGAVALCALVTVPEMAILARASRRT
jgi:MFS family permease